MRAGRFDDGTITIGTDVDQGGFNTGLKKLQKKINRFGAAVGGAFGLAMLIKLGKTAVQAASDLEEVQNIVDVTFKKFDESSGTIIDMTDKIEEFSKTCIEKFGMSELSAKRTAGSFMAMGNAMGLTMEQASDMAVNLTALSGDFASFYNITQDYAKVALSGVYTGETETLKRYGIIITEANLQQYALEQGITKSVKKMGAAEKLMLRYNYIMKVTAQTAGDFARTQYNWANSVKVLKEVWNQFMVTIGTALKTFLKPLLRTLIQIVQALDAFARKAMQVLSDLFGIVWDTGDTGGGSAIADTYDDATESIEDTTEAQKKLNKATKDYLSPLDEITKWQEDKDTSADSGAGDGGLGDIGLNDFSAGDWKKAESVFDNINASLAKFTELGHKVRDTLIGLMDNIDWATIQQKARDFGARLAAFLNGVFDKDGEGRTLFGECGRTLAELLNTIVDWSLAFTGEFDFKDFGHNLADGINKFFETFDFLECADALNEWVDGLEETIKTFLGDLDKDKIKDGFEKFFSRLDWDTIFVLASPFMIKGLKAALPKLLAKLGASLGKKAAEGAAGLTFVDGVLAIPVALAIADIIWSTKGATKEYWKTIEDLQVPDELEKQFNFWDKLQIAIKGTNDKVEDFAKSKGKGLTSDSDIPTEQLTFWDKLAGMFGKTTKHAQEVNDAYMKLKDSMTDDNSFVPSFVNTGDGSPFAEMKLAFEGLPEWFESEVKTPLGEKFNDLANSVNEQIDKMDWKALGEKAKSAVDTVKSSWSGISGWFSSTVTEPIKQKFENLRLNVQSKWENLKLKVEEIWSTVHEWFNANVTEPIKQKFENAKEDIQKKWNNLKATVQTMWSPVADWFRSKVTDPITKTFNTAKENINRAFSNLWDNIANKAKSAFNSVISFVEGALNGILDGVNWVVDKINTASRLKASIFGGSYTTMNKVSSIRLPRLATGAVIPPNKEFMAVLGDQKHGTNLEAPEGLIRQIMREELANIGNMSDNSNGGTYQFVAQLNRKTIFEEVVQEGRLRQMTTGYNPFELT